MQTKCETRAVQCWSLQWGMSIIIAVRARQTLSEGHACFTLISPHSANLQRLYGTQCWEVLLHTLQQN